MEAGLVEVRFAFDRPRWKQRSHRGLPECIISFAPPGHKGTFRAGRAARDLRRFSLLTKPSSAPFNSALVKCSTRPIIGEIRARDRDLIEQVYHRLRDHYGSRRERPGAAFDALLEVLLSPNAQRENVDRAIDNLREAGLLDPRALAEAPADELAALIEPAGNARRKAARLRNLLRYVVERHDGSLATMFATDVETLRTELVAINSLGRETADEILLIAGHVPIFVVDLHAHRVFKRHGWTEFDADGEALRQQVESGLERDAAVLAEFHELIARVGREHCRKTPECEGCPLAELLPEGGPLEPAC